VLFRSIERGKDPRAFTLCAFGGAGGLHACGLAERLGIERVIVPVAPGVFSATGLASAPAGVEAAMTIFASPSERARIDCGFLALERRARARLRAQGIGPGGVRTERFADLRYEGQSHEITVPAGARMAEAFGRAHLARYGYVREGARLEVVTLRVRAAQEDLGFEGVVLPGRAARSARGSLHRPQGMSEGSAAPLADATLRGAGLRPHGSNASDRRRRAASPANGLTLHAAAEDRGRTSVVFRGGRLACSIVRRDSIRPGAQVDGPARITEYSATTFLPPGWRATCGSGATLILVPTGATADRATSAPRLRREGAR